MSTGDEITYARFRELLSDLAYRPYIVPLIQLWFGYDVIPVGDGFVLRDRSGVEVNPQLVHEAIQADPDRRYSLYQTAMSLWR